jgi:hypothetical protein
MQSSSAPPVVIDVEASGFGRGSYPIEIGTVLDDGTRHCYLVRPEPEWSHWDGHAEAVHGIPRDILFDRGLPVLEVAQKLNEELGRRVVYSDGWGVDRSWLALLFDCAQIPQLFKLESIRALLDEEQVATWHDAKNEIMMELDLQRHRASADALIVQRALVRVGV